MIEDYNFDELASRFQRKVYGGLKGQIRIAVLERDFHEFFPGALASAREKPLHIFDAGGGFGPFSILMAQKGHRVTICDLSEKMLEMAREHFMAQGVDHLLSNLAWPGTGIRPRTGRPIRSCSMPRGVGMGKSALNRLSAASWHLMGENGTLSLSFYNLNGMIFKNLLRTNYKKILKKAYTGYPGSLTPCWPRTCEQVTQWLLNHPFEIFCQSGIRVFHDYILNPLGPGPRSGKPDSAGALLLPAAPFPGYGKIPAYSGKKIDLR